MRPQRQTSSQYPDSAPALHIHSAAAPVTAAKPASKAHDGAHAAQTTSTSRPFGLMVNAAPASAPAHSGRRFQASHTAAMCGASISKSAARGITQEGNPKTTNNPTTPPPPTPSPRPHTPP